MNKLKLFIFISFVTLSMSANAQLGIGLKGGADINSVTRSTAGRVDVTFHEKVGLDYGLILKYQFNDWFAFRTNVELLSRSHTMKRNLPIIKDVYTDYRNTYLTLPLMADFSFGGTKLRGHFMMGAYVGCWLSAKMSGNTFDLDLEVNPFDEKMDFNEYHNRIAAGAVGGPGLSCELSEKITMELDALFYYDLTSYMKVSKVSPEPRYNNTLSLTLGLIYKL